MNKTQIFIIITTWNGENYISDCIDSIYKNHIDSGFTVLVVDNGSTDQTKNIIKENYTEIILIENKENLGFSAGNNIGIKAALKNGAEYVVLLNQDTEVSPGFLDKCMAFMNSSPDVGLATPIILYPDKKRIWFSGSKIYRGKEILSFAKIKIGEHIRKKCFYSKDNICTSVDWIPACALFIRGTVFERIGFFDETFFMYGEDVDFCLRATRAGIGMALFPEAHVIHKEPLQKSYHNQEMLFKKIKYKLKSRFIIIKRYFTLKDKLYFTIKCIFFPFLRSYIELKRIYHFQVNRSKISTSSID